MSKISIEYKNEVKNKISNLPSYKEKWDFLYNLILLNHYRYQDLRKLLDIDQNSAMEIFEKLNLKTCSSSNCPNGKAQSRNNFNKNNKKTDGLHNYCKTCEEIKKKKIRLNRKQKNQRSNKKYKKCSSPNCLHNGELQPINNFYKRTINNDGYSIYCKDCVNKADQKKRKRNQKKNHYNNPIEYKICSNDKCLYRNQYQSTSNFQRVTSNNDGLSHRCKTCISNKTMIRYAYYDKRKERLKKYHEIRRDPNNPILLQVKCALCEDWFNPISNQVDRRISSINGRITGENNFYCSEECKNACPIYRKKFHRRDDPNRINLDREVQPELRELVLERDNHTCIKCRKTNNLHCHHVEGIRWEPLESADIDKCITVCEDCHKEIHKIPGCSYNDMQCNY